MTWMIVVTCVANILVCGSNTIPSPVGTFQTRERCDRALVQFAREIDPKNGAYRFSCERL